MSKSIERFGLGLFLMLLAGPAMADGWTAPDTITEILVSPSRDDDDTSLHVYFTGLTTDADCSDTFPILLSGTDVKSLESLLTAAFLSGKRVSCYVDGCDLGPDDSFWTVPKTRRCKIVQ